MAEGERSSVDVGVDLGGGKTALALVDDQDRTVLFRRHPTRAGAGPEAIVDDLATFVSDALEGAGRGIRRLGIGVCGQVVRGTGVVRAAPNLRGWDDFPLRDRLEDRLGVPVAVANDLHMISLGEWRHGAGRGVDDLVVVFVGTGVGGGVISGARLLQGHAGHAGELGHVTVAMGGRKCSCGNRGCLEAYAGGWAIAERAREAVEQAGKSGGDPAGKPSALLELVDSLADLTSQTVSEAHQRGDPLAGRIAEETGRYLAAGMVGVVNAFNPRRLVLGGGVLDGFPELVDVVRSHVSRAALDASARDLEIVRTELGDEAGALGGVVLARQLYPEPEPTVERR